MILRMIATGRAGECEEEDGRPLSSPDYLTSTAITIGAQTLTYVLHLTPSQDGMVRLMGNHLIIPGGTRQIDALGK